MLRIAGLPTRLFKDDQLQDEGSKHTEQINDGDQKGHNNHPPRTPSAPVECCEDHDQNEQGNSAQKHHRPKDFSKSLKNVPDHFGKSGGLIKNRMPEISRQQQASQRRFDKNQQGLVPHEGHGQIATTDLVIQKPCGKPVVDQCERKCPQNSQDGEGPPIRTKNLKSQIQNLQDISLSDADVGAIKPHADLLGETQEPQSKPAAWCW